MHYKEGAMKVTRKEMADMMKTFLVSMLCGLPIVIILNLSVGSDIPSFALVLIDCTILLACSFIGYVIVDKHRKRIAQKRAEFESKNK